ncbi:uncharacterized protein RCC_00915 [Ramularia collo-cygni]|uniref:Methyltransferase domain-containing protein n=1 Tax=Ramularia collo-cygni TaxID=112498 RepID=A0A2D3V0H1_9PEZI|nr:uncharacterized protein RCC_00915 [Ramularia collo-cygni]CZT14999.1 uncharacterized protein RCC_00915 [Ramularia collo-cygni]
MSVSYANLPPQHARLDASHNNYLALMGKILHAPVSSPKSILDVGAGTGLASVSLAKTFPGAAVTGIDIQPVPEIHAKPGNVTYVVGNVNDASLPAPFDVVFSRLMIAGMTNWPGYISKVNSLLAPGGWAEFQELNLQMFDAAGNVVPDDGPAEQIFATTEKMGLDFKAGPKIKGWLESAGFKNVVQVVYDFPLGGKGQSGVKKDFGEWFLGNIKETLPISAQQILGGLTPEVEAIQKTKMEKAEAEGWSMKFYVTYGQK